MTEGSWGLQQRLQLLLLSLLLLSGHVIGSKLRRQVIGSKNRFSPISKCLRVMLQNMFLVTYQGILDHTSPHDTTAIFLSFLDYIYIFWHPHRY